MLVSLVVARWAQTCSGRFAGCIWIGSGVGWASNRASKYRVIWIGHVHAARAHTIYDDADVSAAVAAAAACRDVCTFHTEDKHYYRIECRFVSFVYMVRMLFAACAVRPCLHTHAYIVNVNAMNFGSRARKSRRQPWHTRICNNIAYDADAVAAAAITTAVSMPRRCCRRRCSMKCEFCMRASTRDNHLAGAVVSSVSDLVY